MQLDIFSDPICPWCYIGKANLDAALTEENPFTVEWHPFLLNPDMPAEGMDRRTYLETKFGGKENAVKAYAPIAEAAEAAGLEIDLAAIKRTPNTVNAHRLIHWAGIERRQTPVVDALFRAYFVEGRDIGVSQVLVEIATDAAMTDVVHRQEELSVRQTHAGKDAKGRDILEDLKTYYWRVTAVDGFGQRTVGTCDDRGTPAPGDDT